MSDPRRFVPPPGSPAGDEPSVRTTGEAEGRPRPVNPGFMDVGALVAQARGEPPTRPHENAQTSAAAQGAQVARPVPYEAPAEPAPMPRMPNPAFAKAKPESSRWALKLAILAIALVLVAVGVLLLLPVVVRDRAIAGAKEAGFIVTIDRVGVGFDGVTLRGVTAKSIRSPGITATIQEVHAAGISGRSARLLGVDAQLQGEASDLEVGMASILAESRARFAGTPSSPQHLSVLGARATWTDTSGRRLSASDVGLEVDSRGAGVEDVHSNVGRFELTSKTGAYGPWACTFEKSPTDARLRVMFDPPVPDGPSALVVWGTSMPTELTVKIPRSPFKNLGIEPSDCGLPADEVTDVEVKVQGKLSETVRSEVTAEATLWGLRPKGFSGPIDVHMEGAASRTSAKPFELEKTTVTVGPFTAGVTGTVTPHDRGLRLDALFKTLPMPCERLAKAEAKNMGPLAAMLQALGQSTGALRVTGTVNASGVVKYDTEAPEAASVTWLAKETCGVSIFGM